MYVLCQWKAGIFGICSEGVPKQINFLIDKTHCTFKGSIVVISYLDYFFKNYGFGEMEVDVSCDNCCRQNKNYILAHLIWHVVTNQHRQIGLHFLFPAIQSLHLVGDLGCWRFHRTEVLSLCELHDCVNMSTLSGINAAHIVGLENGPADVPRSTGRGVQTVLAKRREDSHNADHSSSSGSCCWYFHYFIDSKLQHYFLQETYFTVQSSISMTHY